MNMLNNVMNNYIFGITASMLVPEDAWQSTLGRTAGFESPLGSVLKVDLSALALNMSVAKYRKILVEEFENCLKRSMMREAHEIILLYCEKTGQYDKYKSQPRFQFARIIRNVVSHKQGGVLTNWPKDLSKKGITTVQWRARSLDTKMVGSEVKFTHNEVLQLFLDQRDFAQKELI